jgi:hypothetical protein
MCCVFFAIKTEYSNFILANLGFKKLMMFLPSSDLPELYLSPHLK